MATKFDPDFALIASGSDLFSSENIFLDDDSDNQSDDIVILHMDIREPLSKLKTLLEKKIGINLKAYKFWLQNAQMLEPDKNLVDQCVEGEGIVQINVQILTTNRRINIVDVLKPTEEALQLLAKEPSLSSLNEEKDSKKKKKSKNSDDDNDSEDEEDDNDNKTDIHDIIKDASMNDDDDNALKWILDTNCQFRKDQIKLKIPDDPAEWSVAHVQHWLQWAVREFNMVNIKLSDWNINGKELCDLSLKDFEKKVPNDPGNIFRTHFELLRKCKFVAILQNRNTLDMKLFDNNDDDLDENSQHEPKIMKKNRKRPHEDKFSKGSTSFSSLTLPSSSNLNILTNLESNSNTTTRSSNGQIQLWQFLLDLLTNYEYRSIIHWISADGEFRLANPENVAKLWGIRKNKPSMNYEKLSRALRYYYDGDMISKVHGKRFVYKFVCDLKQLIGYDAREITRLINQCILGNKNA